MDPKAKGTGDLTEKSLKFALCASMLLTQIGIQMTSWFMVLFFVVAMTGVYLLSTLVIKPWFQNRGKNVTPAGPVRAK